MGDTNLIDPMKVNFGLHDLLPKAFLDSGYVGDGYPDCDQLPPLHWLTPGARYVYTGAASIEGPVVDAQSLSGPGLRGRLTPLPSSSALYRSLCQADGTGRCTFPNEVVLTDVLPCDGQECGAGRVISVRIVDPVAGVTGYYTYESVPCVRLSFFNQGQIVKAGTNAQCANPESAIAMPTCCRKTNPLSVASNFTAECLFANEYTNYATAQARCNAMGLPMCSSGFTGGSSWAGTCAPNTFMWSTGACRVQVQVYDGGHTAIVDPQVVGSPGNTPSTFKLFKLSSGNMFRVYWLNGLYPSPASASGCGAGCTAKVDTFGVSCLCDLVVNTSAVFNVSASVPSAAAIVSTLFIGAPVPSTLFGYTKCTSAACLVSPNVTVWLKSGSNPWDVNTIFQVPAPRAGGAAVYLFNQQSWVLVGNYSFRNPPNFMPALGAQPNFAQSWNANIYLSRVMLEMEAYLDMLFWHPNVAPFISKLLIQRMVTSNPSPRYVQAVSTAFQTGKYGTMTFSGLYGDLGATAAAILLDREATSPIIEVCALFGLNCFGCCSFFAQVASRLILVSVCFESLSCVWCT
jgi:hypothetical protein